MNYLLRVFVLSLLLLVQASLTTVFAIDSLPATPRTNRINILFLMDDQHRGDWLGAAGAGWMITPNLDRLAHEGVLFRRAYSSVPSCLAARAALLTGLSPWGHGVLGYTPMPAHFQHEKPQLFTDAGYRTCAVGKQHFSPPRNTHGYETVILSEPKLNDAKAVCDYTTWFTHQAPGHDVMEGYRSGNDQRGGIHYPVDEKLHETVWTANQAVEFLTARKAGAPWFLKVSFHSPHAPLNAPKRWYDRYEGANNPGANRG
jgi:arylsulfatase A-like enzyme